MLSPREVAERLGFSYHAVLRAIRRGELKASEPIKGRYRIAIDEYRRWAGHPIREKPAPSTPRAPRRARARQAAGSFERLTAIERTG
jgi:excisionase family DNA binding protein